MRSEQRGYFISFMKKAKIVLVGAMATGKSSITNRYVNGEFSLHTVSTTQPAFAQKELVYKKREISLEIWDTAGQERYHALSPLFYRDSEAGIVVFDITNEESFTKASKWVNELKQARGDQIFIVLAGNKCDLEAERKVDKAEAMKLAQNLRAPYFETSALKNINIDCIFNAICDDIIEKWATIKTDQPSKSLKSSIQFEDENQTKEKKGCC